MIRTLRVGGACGFWGEAPGATAQLLGADVDVIVYDYLAEITMSIMARARARDPAMGYAPDFLTAALGPNLAAIADRGVKIISNAGGLNPLACAERLRAMIAEKGLALRVAVITGDDLSDRLERYAAARVTEMFSGAPFPPLSAIASANAYLGAFPIAAALDAGADIVLTGRCVDSALTLGPCIHAFGWSADNLDRLAGGSLAGHILECGPQATGGNHTDWELVAESIETIGYPIAEIEADGAFTLTKPAGTGGVVSIGSVGEQMLYEIGDPQAYTLPDVICDFSAVTLTQAGPDRVRLAGARGRGVPDGYKVSLTHQDGWRGVQLFGYYGADAPRKARRFAEAALSRAEAALRRAGLAGFSETSIEILGTEAQFGAEARRGDTREVTLKLAVRHPEKAGAQTMFSEAVGLALAAPPGLCGFGGGLGRPSPVVRLFSFIAPKADIRATLRFDGRNLPVEAAPRRAAAAPAAIRRPAPPPPVEPGAATGEAALVRLAWLRSGDKGDKANVGVMARDPAYLPYIWAALTPALLRARLGHVVAGEIDMFLLPGAHAINLLLHDALGGGGIASLRNDPQGKGFSQLLLDCPIPIPEDLIPARGRRS